MFSAVGPVILQSAELKEHPTKTTACPYTETPIQSSIIGFSLDRLDYRYVEQIHKCLALKGSTKQVEATVIHLTRTIQADKPWQWRNEKPMRETQRAASQNAMGGENCPDYPRRRCSKAPRSSGETWSKLNRNSAERTEVRDGKPLNISGLRVFHSNSRRSFGISKTELCGGQPPILLAQRGGSQYVSTLLCYEAIRFKLTLWEAREFNAI